MQSVSSRIWTRVAVFISNDDTHYTTGTSTNTILPVNCILIDTKTPDQSEPGSDSNGDSILKNWIRTTGSDLWPHSGHSF